AYLAWGEIHASAAWREMEAAGATPQRLLWASTGTKDPAYPDTLYVDALIGSPTVNTVPPATLKAFLDHGRAAPTLAEGTDQAADLLRELARRGVDLPRVTARLQEEGVAAFAKSFDGILAAVAAAAGRP
ncbi:MAG: transaldolase family protein, partial [Elusimicrobiales bacterium]|nr:transaldolase family protein [Elusimicrobiales bacterium]